jgi:hypothetical protein
VFEFPCPLQRLSEKLRHHQHYRHSNVPQLSLT